MNITYGKTNDAVSAFQLVQSVQHYFIQKLEPFCKSSFQPVTWYRSNGENGGGVRYESPSDDFFNRASLNISQVQYENLPEKPLNSATALSTIVHPHNPHCPSLHMHISWTALKSGKGYWRIMADLNPSIPYEEDRHSFLHTIKEASEDHYDIGLQQGDTYFFIPPLNRHRGVAHFYLENFNRGDFEKDYLYAKYFGINIINAYISLLFKRKDSDISPSDQSKQLDYHTLYFYQVLTLDRGTTAGLLIHNENDIGILGSLPSRVNRSLLTSWIEQTPTPQDKLLQKLLNQLPDEDICIITESIKKKLADVIRVHYKQYPEGLSLQASGNTIPTTVENHQQNSDKE